MVQRNSVNSALFRAIQKSASSLFTVPHFLSFSEDIYSSPIVGGLSIQHYPPRNHFGTTAEFQTHTVTHTTK